MTAANLRLPAVVAAVAVIMIMVTSCTGGRNSPGGSASPNGHPSATTSAVAYAACMRSHGVPKYPDPASNGALPKGGADQFGVSGTVFDAAQSACQHLLPATGGSLEQQIRQCYQGGVCPPTLVQQMMALGQKFAECMRSHGVSNWPDPSLDPEGKPIFDLTGHGWAPGQWHSSAIVAKSRQCATVAGGALVTG